MIEKWLNGPINFLELRKKHWAINDVVERLEAELILFELNPKCEGFHDLIDKLVLFSDKDGPGTNLHES